MFYHVIIKPKSDKYYGEYKTDLTKEQLISRFVEPYEQGMPIVINGKTVQPNDLERIIPVLQSKSYYTLFSFGSVYKGLTNESR